jgi:hypothetical protein
MKLSKGKQEIKDFMDKHGACADVREWSMTKRSMSNVWKKAKHDWLIWLATREGVIEDKTLRMFACWCARNTPIGNEKTTWDMMLSEDCKNAVIVAEKYANGDATEKELSAALASASAYASASAAASQDKQLRKMTNPFKGKTK